MYPSTPVYSLLSEAGLISASTLLDYRQRLYAYQLLSLLDEHPAKQILPISLRIEDGSFQPGELPDNIHLCGRKMHDPRLTDIG